VRRITARPRYREAHVHHTHEVRVVDRVSVDDAVAQLS
jgi:hypothetical protein